MGLETGSFINDLVETNPLSGDSRSEGDNHLRLIKSTLKATFPGMVGRSWRVQAKSAGYTPVLNDNMSVLACTASLTLSLTAAATLGNGWMVQIFAVGGNVTIDPNSTEQVNGASTAVIPSGFSGLLFCTGTAFYLMKAYLDDGDKGDITLSANGTVWTIDALAVSAGKLSDTVVHDMTAVTAASNDYVLIADTSDSNKKKKALISDIVALAAAAASSFPSGTRMAFNQTSAPTGWTKDTTAALNDSIMRIVTGTVGSGGSNAFSTFNGQTSVGATTLAESQIPSHSHVIRGASGSTVDTTVRNMISNNRGTNDNLTSSSSTATTGGGGSHTHTITTAIKYNDFIIASKD